MPARHTTSPLPPHTLLPKTNRAEAPAATMASSSNNEGTPPSRLANKAFHAASQGTVDDLKKLAKKMDLAVLRDGAGETLLHSAARWGTTKETCRFLVEKCGLDINALSKLGATPMFLAAGATGTKRGVQTLSDLANLGADHSIPDQTDSTPLHNAVRKGYWEAVHLLLSIGAHVDPIGFRGTPLHEAIAKDRCDIAKLLLDHGADKNKLVYNMSSPVGLAVCNRSLKCLKLLIEAGANVNAHGNDSPSPLVYVIEYDLIDHVKLLLEAGADPNIRCEMEKPHMFQFVPNEKQVKAANKLLKSIPQRSRRKKLAGVPVFSAQNLNIAVATNDGIRWYSPYFFDKNLLDNILEASMDQHFHSMIQNRHVQRRRDIVDDSLTSEILEESADSLFEPPEVQELMKEIGPAGIPLSIVTKAAEIQFLDVVDRLLLGNKWLRRATGIQPHFPYVVDSFEERTAVSVDRIAASSNSSTATKDADCCPINQQSQAMEPNLDSGSHGKHNSQDHGQSHFPFSNLLPNIWPGHDRAFKRQENGSRSRRYDASMNSDLQANPLLPKITMVGISMSEGGQMSKANLKKTMDDLTKELEQAGERPVFSDEKDPLFVANVGDYSRITKISSA